MRWLGRLSGNGILTCEGETIGPIAYDIDGYARAPSGVTGSGEVRLRPDELAKVFGRRHLMLVTEDGRSLGLRFSDKELHSADGIAHVDVEGDLPGNQASWTH